MIRRLTIILVLSSIPLLVNAERNSADIPDAWMMLDIQTTTGDRQTQQLASVGFSIEWEHVGVDVSHGRKQIDDSSWETGSELGVRIYPFRMNKVRPLLIVQHTSDITRGGQEPVQNYLGVGATIVFKRLELDISIGRKRVDHSYNDGIVLGVRFYPFRKNGRSRWE